MADRFGPHLERLLAVAVSRAGDRVAVAGERDRSAGAVDTAVTVLGWPSLTPVATLALGGAATGLAYAAGDAIVVATARGALEIWSPAGDRVAAAEDRHRGAIRAVACDAEGRRVATAGDDGTLCVSTLDGPGRSHELSGRSLRAAAFDPGGAWVAAGGDDGVVRVLGLGNGDSRPREIAMPEAVTAIEPLGDGRIAVGCADGAIRIAYLEGAADIEDRSRGGAHDGPVRAILLSAELTDEAGRPLPRRLLSLSGGATDPGTLKTWQLDSRRPPRTVDIGGEPTAMARMPAPAGTAAERRGGTLVIVDRRRWISLVAIAETAVPGDSPGSIERLCSRLDELSRAIDSSAAKEPIIAALAALPEDEARQLLDRALARGEKPSVRAAAAAAIGDSDRRLSRPALRSALEDADAAVRQAALEALTRIDRNDPVAVARAALASGHGDMRIESLRRLPGLRQRSPLVPALVAGALDDGEAEVRAAALESLYALEGDRPLEAARIALSRGPADVRREVLVRIARADLAAEPEAAHLVESSFDDDDEAVRKAAFVAAIASCRPLAARARELDPGIAAALEELTPGRAATAPANLEDDALRPLFAAMACRSFDIALGSARLLALLGDRRSVGALLQLSREAEPVRRRQVVGSLWTASQAMADDPRAVDRLRWLLDDPDETVRQEAFARLAALCGDEARGAGGRPDDEIELAALALRARWPDIRVRALPILVKVGPEAENAALAARAEELLGDALDDEHDKVRGEAFRTLWAWHSREPAKVLGRAAHSRQAEVRRRAVAELGEQRNGNPEWADNLLLELVRDGSAEVGLAAFDVLTDSDGSSPEPRRRAGKERVEVHLAAMESPRPEVRARGCQTVPATPESFLVVEDRLLELIEDDHPAVHIAAIEALDRLDPDHASGFALAFGSIYYELRVRAMELAGRRRDRRAVEPAQRFLSIPEGYLDRPPPPLRQRAARALADAGDPDAIPFLIGLLDDGDPVVREMAARGLATACRPGGEKPLLDATSHQDLAVRSWAAEGLARLGDDRALPVLAGTQGHDHLPIRIGAILGFVALGPDGVRGILAGLDDPVREIQDLVFAVIVARDIALQGVGEPPDLLLSALSSAHPEIRFAAARLLEGRAGGGDAAELVAFASRMIGPREPEKPADMKEWPDEAERDRRLEIVVRELASDHPAHRYAAAQVLTLRSQPLAFWREAAHLIGPTLSSRPRIPFTSWDDEPRQPHKRGWIRSLLPRGAGARFDAEASQLAFGTYAGLVRQAPAPGEADETHRVRRDALARLAALAASPAVGREAVLPVLRRALSDPHHLVRRAAVAALRELYPEGSLEPLALELGSSAADVGRGAVNELIAKAEASAEARALALETINAPVAEVRQYALGQLPRLFDAGSIEPWLVAIESRHADVRLSVVYRLVSSSDERVVVALGRAMESDHEDLRLQAAAALARRGDLRTVDVLAGLLHSDDNAWEALEALTDLASVQGRPEAAAAAARAVVSRLEDDPDQTADRYELLEALEQIASPAAADFLLTLVADEELDSYERDQAFGILVSLAVDDAAGTWRDPWRVERPRFHAERALAYAGELAAVKAYRCQVIERLLRDVEDPGADPILAALLDDRDESVRVAACEALAFRAQVFGGAGLAALSSALRGGRRELVLPAAEGLAAHQRREAFQPLMLVFVAGEQGERERAALALGALGDPRAVSELEALLDASGDIEDGDRALQPVAAQALATMLGHLEPGQGGTELADRVRARVEELGREGDADMRQMVFAGLRAAGDERSRAFLEAVAGDRLEQQSARLAAIGELGALCSPASEPVLIDAVREGDYQIVTAALDTLEAIFPEDRTRTSLIALESALSHLSEPAASYLAWRGDTDTLVSRLAEIGDRGVREQLRLGLIRRGVAPAQPVTALLASDEAIDRIEGAWIAGAAGDRGELASAVAAAAARAPEALAAARARLAGRGDEVGRQRVADAEEAWAAALWAAARLGADARRPALAALQGTGSSRPPPSVRLAALRYLGERGDAGEVGPVLASLSDPDPEVRKAAAAAAASLAPERAPAALAAIDVPDAAAVGPLIDVAIRRDAAALMKSGSSRRLALPALIAEGGESLIEIAGGPGEDAARLAAIAALGRRGDERSESALRGILDRGGEPDAVRAEAYRSLRRLERRVARLAAMESPPEGAPL